MSAKSVGTQYAEPSPTSPQLDSPPSSDAAVVAASTARFPTYVWLCEAPGFPGLRGLIDEFLRDLRALDVPAAA